LLRAVYNTAVQDGAAERNPCRIIGAGVENAAERPTLTISQVMRLVDLFPDRLSVMVLLGCFGSLRYGEATALRRMDVDVVDRVVFVRSQLIELSTGLTVGPPKSRAGVRAVGLPTFVAQALAAHLAAHVAPEPEALLFTRPNGQPLRRSGFNKAVGWTAACTAIGAPDLHFSRLASHRKHVGGRDARNVNPRPHGQDGARQDARRPHLPARDPGRRPPHR
jgi:integrase